jgi:hypothetical protein
MKQTRKKHGAAFKAKVALAAIKGSALPVSRQCRLLAVSRASVYRRPAEISEENCTIVALIDRQYLARPYYGSRRMAAWLATQGHVVNRKRVRLSQTPYRRCQRAYYPLSAREVFAPAQ